eukprot:TRINITY_DN5805_c0_g1_i1.p1 TRINITY_DN5805_c0_g1~~TRINITY_DN5805_c0_g1_i1.p1  ORF type:complete len:317 (+),score=59.99 TRINITY_DN5805_c0_g1_i1:30-980(+)
MVAVGYVVETVVWEAACVFLVVFASVELCLAQVPANKAKQKSLQKRLYPCALLTGIIGLVMGVDLRGVFGVYRDWPRLPRIILELSDTVPTVTWGLLWLQQLCDSSFRSSGYSGPCGIGNKPKWQKGIVAFLVLNYVLLIILSCALMDHFNLIRYGLILWAAGILLCFGIHGVTWKLLRVMTQTSHMVQTPSAKETSSTERSFKSYDSARIRFKTMSDREWILVKLQLSQVLGLVLTLFIVCAMIYHFTLGWNETLDPYTTADPIAYTFSPVVFLAAGSVVVINISCLAGLGSIVGCMPSEPGSKILVDTDQKGSN